MATAALVTATQEATDLIARVRGAYISGSDLSDRTPELARIGLQPRRLPGEAGNSLRPDAPGTAVYDAAAKTLSLPGLPANSTSLRAYRQAAGGARELCGISLTATVSVVMTSPLNPGVTYEVWAVGVLTDREGPESNRVAVTG